MTPPLCKQRDDTASATLHCLCVGVAATLAAAIALVAFEKAGASWTSFTLLCFALGYVGVALAVEPLVAAVGAVYVTFAEVRACRAH